MSMWKTKRSKKGRWWIDSERRLELVHFTKQLYTWIEEYNNYDISSVNTYDEKVTTSDVADRTAKTAIKKAEYAKKIDMVNQAARKAVYDVCTWMDFDTRCLMADKVLDSVIYDKAHYALDIDHLISQYKFYQVKDAYFWYLDKLRG